METRKSFIRRHFAVSVFALLAPLALADPAVQGVPNFQAVNEHVLRGGQPSEEGFRSLAVRGVKTVVDLRQQDDRSKAEKKLVESLGMRYVNIPMQGMHTPSDKQISRALRILKSDSATPVFVHCKRGADRTGAVVACYRIQHDQWDNARALHEAREYGMSWYQFPLKRYVLAYHPHGNGIAGTADEVADTVRGYASSAADAMKNLSQGATEAVKGLGK